MTENESREGTKENDKEKERGEKTGQGKGNDKGGWWIKERIGMKIGETRRTCATYCISSVPDNTLARMI